MKKNWFFIICGILLLVWIVLFLMLRKNLEEQTPEAPSQNREKQVSLPQTTEETFYQELSDLFEWEGYENVEGEYGFTAEWF